jgi:hypothetical protein
MSGQGNYDNNMRFTLFKNKKKVPGDTKPEYTGKIEIDGKLYWLSAWVKTPNQGGEKFMSGTVRPVDEPGAPPARGPAPQGREKFTNRPPPSNPIQDGEQFKEDDIPF